MQVVPSLVNQMEKKNSESDTSIGWCPKNQRHCTAKFSKTMKLCRNRADWGAHSGRPLEAHYLTDAARHPGQRNGQTKVTTRKTGSIKDATRRVNLRKTTRNPWMIATFSHLRIWVKMILGMSPHFAANLSPTQLWLFDTIWFAKPVLVSSAWPETLCVQQSLRLPQNATDFGVSNPNLRFRKIHKPKWHPNHPDPHEFQQHLTSPLFQPSTSSHPPAPGRKFCSTAKFCAPRKLHWLPFNYGFVSESEITQTYRSCILPHHGS